MESWPKRREATTRHETLFGCVTEGQWREFEAMHMKMAPSGVAGVIFPLETLRTF